MAERKARSAGAAQEEAAEQPSLEFQVAARAFTVTLPTFEGPLDLLLHLIREHKLDIFDIPIAFVTAEYLKYLERMKELNLDVAGEFLVMAATLAHIKSRMLLPREEAAEDEAEEEQGDPRADLVRRLLEYQKYKAAAEELARQDLLGRDVFVRQVKAEEIPLGDGELGLKEVSVFKLIEALDKVLSRLKPEKQHEVVLERVSISDAINRIADLLRSQSQVTFFALFDGMTERHRVIATFLGLLEMTRLKLVRIFQEEVGGDIVIARTDRLGDEGIDVRDDFL